MTTAEIYQLAIKLGIEADLRGRASVKEHLHHAKQQYRQLSKTAKADFDLEKLTNPYADSRILVDLGRAKIKKVLVGIDMEGPELLAAKHLGDIDLVLAHHPEGLGLAGLSEVMDLQADVLADYGVPINIAESLIKPRISEVSRGVSPVNHDRSVDMAKLLGLDFMCIHTPADNLGARYLVDLINKKQAKLKRVSDLLKLLSTIPEYAQAAKQKAGPTLFAGNADNHCGKIAVTEFTGGTSGSKDIYEKMANFGIGTVVGMHMSEEHRREAEKNHINVVIAGHMASDSLGMNLLLDNLVGQGVEVLTTSGLIRIKRN
jgi:putative NIF3 family GTP cyclohydrolase 1 type 2